MIRTLATKAAKLLPHYIGLFMLALAMSVGFVLGTINTTIMAQASIQQMGKDINALIVKGRAR